MDSANDAWEAVFALAGRSVDDSSEPRPEPTSSDVSSRKRKKRRKGSSCPGGRSGVRDDDAVFQAYLKERSSTRLVWPSWMDLQGGYNPQRCGRWADGSSTSAASTESTSDAFAATCTKCHQSPFHHVACASQGAHITPSRQLFLAVRNLRCAAVQLALHAAHPRDEEPVEVPRSLIDRLCDEWGRGTTRIQGLRSGVPESLLLACQQMNPRLLLRVHDAKNKSTSGDVVFEQAARIVISLDNVYFRLYYSHLSRELPLSNDNDEGSDYSGLPHPVSYFGLVAVDLDSYQRLALKFFAGVPATATTSNDTMLFDRFGLAEGVDGWKLKHSALPDVEPALALLHQLRTLETVALFQAWSTRASARRQLVASCRAAIEPHETPAPEILMSWRDSCRDFLCHLYCYATLSGATLDKLRAGLLEHKVNRLLELGAGTGYLAQLLNDRLSGDGVSIEAIDLYPPSASSTATASARNEYHGSTPPFFSITAGSASAIAARRRSDMPRTAMLLCYPPPDSSFAYEALHNFSDCDGRVVVFVGEFKGLTGNAKFERLLQRQYACVDRLPCLCWGTDASTVTIWARCPPAPREVPSSSFLLPCSSCGDAESIRRCRLLRCLSYCSRRCFDRHADSREAALKLVMVDFGEASGLDFDSSRHFLDLSHF